MPSSTRSRSWSAPDAVALPRPGWAAARGAMAVRCNPAGPAKRPVPDVGSASSRATLEFHGLTTPPSTWPSRPLARLAIIALAAIVGCACGTDASPSQPGASASAQPARSARSSGPPGSPDPLSELAAAATQEGSLAVIGLPHDWCGYGDALDTFSTRYGITIQELNQDATFDDQLDALRAGKAGPSPSASVDPSASSQPGSPDVVDIGRSFAAQAAKEKLLAAYRVSTWDSIPDTAKDPKGFWTGDYFGVLALETNATAIAHPPTDWKDLTDPARPSLFALPGDPRVSDQAIQVVYAAALGNGGTLDDATAGLTWFAALHKSGRLATRIADSDSIDAGVTPVTMRWTYNAIAHQDQTDGNPEIDVTVPPTGRLGSYDVQAISAFAAHPNAARLWLEFLFSDEGQNIWLKSHCLPTRLDDLMTRDVIPPEILAKVPDVEGTVFPSIAQLNAASNLITGRWNAVVGADIK